MSRIYWFRALLSQAATTLGAVGGRRPSGTLTGTVALLRFALRRERWSILGWALGLALLTGLVTLSFIGLYPSPEQRSAVAQTMASPAAVAIIGVNYAGANYHYGAMTAHQMLFFSAILVGLMSILMTVRHTRLEESTGRTELVRSAVVGRHAPLASTVLAVVVANLAVGVALALALGLTGSVGVDWGGSLLYGAAHLAVGVSFGSVAAVASQVSENPRGAIGLSLACLGLAYVLRAIGDTTQTGLSRLSPIGWAQATQVFVNDHWAPLLPALVLTLLMCWAASALSDRRDVGAGLWAPRPGARRASAGLGTPFGFAWRQHRGAILGWSTGLFVMGSMYGAFLSDLEEMLAGVEGLDRMLGEIPVANLVDSFAALISGVMAVIASVYTVLASSRPRGEEIAGRAEPLLATSLSRAGWLLGQVRVIALGSLLVLLSAGLGLGLAGSATLGDWSLLPRFVLALVAYAPAHWLVMALVTTLFGSVPRVMPAAWLLVGFSFLVIYLGELLRLPTWLRGLSPFQHVPGYPAEAFTALPLLALSLVALVLFGLAILGFRRRDVPG